ncbi:MAG TPA: hypothetical protein VNC63_10820 [Propionibacteriaceae bacterium]|nr:hypothetical protein [Propionibacteriaceae bacterium]
MSEPARSQRWRRADFVFLRDVLLGRRLDQIPAGPSEEVDLVRLR